MEQASSGPGAMKWKGYSVADVVLLDPVSSFVKISASYAVFVELEAFESSL